MSQHDTDAAEHRSGLRPLGEYPDHCRRCRMVHDCDHLVTDQVMTLAGIVVREYCADCGVTIEP